MISIFLHVSQQLRVWRGQIPPPSSPPKLSQQLQNYRFLHVWQGPLPLPPWTIAARKSLENPSAVPIQSMSLYCLVSVCMASGKAMHTTQCMASGAMPPSTPDVRYPVGNCLRPRQMSCLVKALDPTIAHCFQATRAHLHHANLMWPDRTRGWCVGVGVKCRRTFVASLKSP